MKYLFVVALAVSFLGFAHRYPSSSMLIPITPTSAEPSIDPTYNAVNEVGHPTGMAANLLYVFLPGTNGTPAGYKDILNEALAKGYHAIGLEYPNGEEVEQACKGSGNPNCPGLVRYETITGLHPTKYGSVMGPPDSVVGRLTSLLSYLSSHYPNDGWRQYLSGGNINWSQVVVGGHSQGAGHAAFIGKLFLASGLCDFDSPADVDPASTTSPYPAPAAWLSSANKTSPNLEYGFTNRADQIAVYPVVRRAWDSLPMPPANQLTVNVQASTPAESHGLTVVDGSTPILPSGMPKYLPQWDKACFSFTGPSRKSIRRGL
jgi:hypothetical protein